MSDFTDRVDNMVNDILDRQKDYLEECADYRKRGYRHNVCFHGVNQWVDHDCACGYCEEGELDEYSTLDEVKEYAKDVVEGEIAIEKRKQEEKNIIIELLMKGDKRYSYIEAEIIHNDLFTK